jgi:hypothetical protein
MIEFQSLSKRIAQRFRFEGRPIMLQEVSVLFAGYLAGVIFGSVTSIAIYRRLIETGKIKPLCAGQPRGQSEMAGEAR